MRRSFFLSLIVLWHPRAVVKTRRNFTCERLSLAIITRASELARGRVARSLMDYIMSETVTFELRSIIRNCAIKAPRLLLSTKTRAVKDYTYIRGSDTTRCETSRPVPFCLASPHFASSPRAPSSDFNKNVKFYFQIRRHRRRTHRSCSLSPFSLVFLLGSRVVSPSLIPVVSRPFPTGLFADIPRVIRCSHALFFWKRIVGVISIL